MLLLDEHRIRHALPQQGVVSSFNFHLFNSIDSTNRYLKELPASAQIEVCCAEMQTQGRGRFGRHWHSPFGNNIYCSSRWNLQGNLKRWSGLSLVVSLAVAAVLDQLVPGDCFKIKWPNDILWGEKKICGSLIEIQATSDHTTCVIIGIGLNVNPNSVSNSTNTPAIDRPWGSLFDINQKLFDRNLIIAQLLVKLQCYMNHFIDFGLAYFSGEWNKLDYLKDKYIQVNLPASKLLSGVACGIDESGALRLQDEQGAVHHLSCGDASIQRPVL